MSTVTAWAVPLFVAAILIAATVRRVPSFDEFCIGAGEGLRAAARVLPTLVALITAVGVLRASGFTDLLVGWLRPAAQWLGFPAEVLPLALLRPFSGSGSLVALRQLMAEQGADSLAGQVACVLQSSTETTFYTLTVYFGAVGVRHTDRALPAAVAGDLTGMVLAALTVRLFL